MRRLRILAAVGVLAMVAGACSDNTATPGSGGTTTDSPSPSPSINNQGTTDISSMSNFTVEIDDFYFKPTFMKVKPGQRISIELENEGTNPHTFTVATLSIDETLQPGTKKEINVAVPAGSADVQFVCRFHAEGRGMRGTFFSGSAPQGSGATTGGSDTDPY